MPLAPAARADPVLFVGNSYLEDGGGVHVHAARIAESAAPDIPRKVAASTIRGSRLDEQDVDAALAEGAFRRVVLQGHSTAALTDATRTRFRTAVRRMHEAVASTGAETALYMTPAYSPAHRRYDPEMFDKIAAEYTALGREIGAPVIPVGLAFEIAYRRRPEIVLHQADGSHQTLRGTYLAAAVTAAALFGVDPAQTGYRMDGQLGEDEAAFLRDVAAEAVAWSAAAPCAQSYAHLLGEIAADDYILAEIPRRTGQC